jgi:hypothetical protein
VHIVTPGRITLDGLDRAHPLGLTFDNVFVDHLQPGDIRAADASITLGPGVGNLAPTGSDVRLTRAPGSHLGTPLNCAADFPPFPPNATAPVSAEAVPPLDRSLYVAADDTIKFVSDQQAVNAAPASQLAPYATTAFLDGWNPNAKP